MTGYGARTIKPISLETRAVGINAGYEIIDCPEHALVEVVSRGQQHFCEKALTDHSFDAVVQIACSWGMRSGLLR